jgi:hypothetical protein
MAVETTMMRDGSRPVGQVGRVSGYVLAVVLLVGLAACETTQERVTQREDHLAAAGFVVRTADTPQRQAMLNRLPPHKFVQQVHGQSVSFVYADPLVCDCLYVGSQQAYDKYRQYMQQKQIADEQEATAEMYSDSNWDWNGWGPWGPDYGPVYGAGMGW